MSRPPADRVEGSETILVAEDDANVRLLVERTLTKAGYRVLGLDNDPDKPPMLHRGESYIRHIPAEHIRAMLDAGFERFRFADEHGHQFGWTGFAAAHF